MNFKVQPSSHIRTPNANVSNMMKNVIIALIPIMFFALLQFKLDYVLALVTSLVSVCGFEYLANRIMKREQTLYDMSAVLTAIIFSLTLPIGIYNSEKYSDVESLGYIVGTMMIVVSAAFAIIIGKMVFGGLGRNIFNPAGLGRIFQLISFGAILSYFDNNIAYQSSATPLGVIKDSISQNSSNIMGDLLNSFTTIDMLVGREPGSFGEVSAIAIILGMIYLIYFKIADYRKIVAALGTFSVLAYIYALRMDISAWFVVAQLISGSILFGVAFMVTDPVTAPVTAPGRVLYGMLIGGLTFIIRIFGAYPEGMLFAILIMNMFTPAIDYYRWTSTRFNKTWILTNFITFSLLVSIILIGTR